MRKPASAYTADYRQADGRDSEIATHPHRSEAESLNDADARMSA